jgi:hypothetical protein
MRRSYLEIAARNEPVKGSVIEQASRTRAAEEGQGGAWLWADEGFCRC